MSSMGVLKGKPVDLNIKRLHLPIVIKTNCPTCGHENEEDLQVSNLDYPCTNEECIMEQYCYSCDCRYNIDYLLTLDFEYKVSEDE